jgi:hypothetical protein
MNQPILIKDLGMNFTTKDSKKRKRLGLYLCSCGKEFKANTSNIKNNHTRSCGCKRGNIIHNMSNKRIYRIWNKIKTRVSATDGENYKNYKSRGITMCEEWKDFNNFYTDMKEGYSDNLSIDRIDNNGNYEKSNCRWTDNITQASNTRILRSNNTSGYRGIALRKEINKWKAQIKINYKNIHIVYFKTKIEAAKAYDKYVIDNNLPHTINGV